MGVLNDLLFGLSEDSVVREVHACIFWTAVLSKHCSLASTFHEPRPEYRPVRNAGGLTQFSAVQLPQYAESDNVLEASIGVAAINSFLDIDEARCVGENALAVPEREAKGKNIAVVGRFPWVAELKKVAETLGVIEQSPQEQKLPAEAAEEILPRTDVVGITGTSFINHTIERLLELSKHSFAVIPGSTTLLSPVSFDYDVDVLAAVKGGIRKGDSLH
ncbi:MAG: Rossmann-like domain-containing protein [Dehalococcoidia bacterium]